MKIPPSVYQAGRICIVRRQLCKVRLAGYLQLPMYSTTDAFWFSSGTLCLIVFVFTAEF